MEQGYLRFGTLCSRTYRRTVTKSTRTSRSGDAERWHERGKPKAGQLHDVDKFKQTKLFMTHEAVDRRVSTDTPARLRSQPAGERGWGVSQVWNRGVLGSERHFCCSKLKTPVS